MSVAISNPYPYEHTEQPAGIYEPVTPADADIANVPLVAGYNPIMGCRVISLGTAANIWALR
jgi:hypothetical protein